ncbi:hypothetical protein PFISCL1PPCAC_27996, partial [Pristionchus fissidentatus]
ERWILTAAHCFDRAYSNRNPIVRVGVADIRASMSDDFQSKNVYESKQKILHEEYNKRTIEHDIALLELDRNITYSSIISPICLVSPDQQVHINQEGWLIGFGHYIDETTNELVIDTSNVLREAHIPLARHSDCRGRWGFVDKVICAGGKSLGAGEGDSGGPFMLQSVNGTWYQVGVVSFGDKDKNIAEGHTIGGYTSIGHYCNWIEENTRGEAKCAEKNVEMKEKEEKTENENAKHDEEEEEGREKGKNEEPEDDIEEEDSDEETEDENENDTNDDHEEEKEKEKNEDEGSQEDEIIYIDEKESKEDNSHQPSLFEILSIAH